MAPVQKKTLIQMAVMAFGLLATFGAVVSISVGLSSDGEFNAATPVLRPAVCRADDTLWASPPATDVPPRVDACTTVGRLYQWSASGAPA